MTARRVSYLLTAALLVYLGVFGERAVILLGQPRLALRGLGVAVILVGLLGVFLVAAELRFGAKTTQLGRDLGPDPDELAAEPPRTPGGRIDRAAADAVFEVRQRRVEAAPQDWRAWYRLGVAYGDAGDTRRGRAAVRRAIALRASRPLGWDEGVPEEPVPVERACPELAGGAAGGRQVSRTGELLPGAGPPLPPARRRRGRDRPAG